MKHFKILREASLLNPTTSKEQNDAYYSSLKQAYNSMNAKEREEFIEKTILIIKEYKHEKHRSKGRRLSNWREVVAANRE